MLFWTALPNWSWYITAVTTNTRPRLWRIFPLCWKLVFRGRQSTVSMVFSRAHADWEGSLIAEWWEKTNKNNFEWRRRFYYFIKMKDYIVKTTRSVRADWNSRNTPLQFAWMFSGCLFNCMKTRETWKNCQGVETQKKTKDITRATEKSFLWMEGVFENEFWNQQIYLISFFMLSNKIQN